VENSLLCGVCVVDTCMCVLCVREMYIQWWRHAPEQTHIHILMQTLMYVEVWNIIVCNQNVTDPNKQEQTPDIVRETWRPWRLSDSWEHIVERRERRRHSHARTQTHTRIHARTQTHVICTRKHVELLFRNMPFDSSIHHGPVDS